MENKSNVLVFKHPEFESVRVVDVDGEPWFVGRDIATALGYKDTTSAISAHVDDEDRMGWQITTPSRGIQTVTVINESGMYSLVLRSQLESAKKFKHWVTSEVLPSIRKTGKYDISQNVPSYQIEDPAERARRWADEYEERASLEAKNTVLVAENEEMKPKARIYDNLIDSRLLTNFRDAAKEIGISQTQFTGWLEENGYIYRTSRKEIRPMERYMESGLFQLKPYQNPYNFSTGTRTFLTPTGLATFKIMLEDSGQTRHTMRKHGGRNGRQQRG